jgi:single-stranded DNA-specific DHH superfamily exonuclease
MALTERHYRLIKDELDSCQKPLFFFHDDPDGLCSFLQVYKYKGEGYGVIVKSRPLIDRKFLNKVHDYKPDKIFVLDIAMMEQEFVDEAHVPIVWIDHHPPQEIQRVKYFNPRNGDPKDHPCIAYITYKVVEQSLWLAVVGSVSDMHWPEDLLADYRKKYPDLLPGSFNDARAAFYQDR